MSRFVRRRGIRRARLLYGAYQGVASADLRKRFGTRCWRGLAVPGGMKRDVTQENARGLGARVAEAARDFAELAQMILETPSIQNRFESTGTLKRDLARALGIVGPAARASGLKLDVRSDHPYGHYRTLGLEVPHYSTGDVMARARVRIDEAAISARLIAQTIEDLPAGAIVTSAGYAAAVGQPNTDTGRTAVFSENTCYINMLPLLNQGYLGNMSAIILQPQLPGDAVGDGRVDINDLTIVLTNFGKTGMAWNTGDFNGDGRVDVNDLTILLSNFGRSTGSSAGGMAAVPEPCALTLAGVLLAGLAVFARCFIIGDRRA